MPNDLPVPPPVPHTLPAPVPQQSQAYPAPMYGEPPASGGPDWRRVFASVMRYKWLVLGVVVLGTLAGFALSRFLIKPGYLARATIWVDVVDPRARTSESYQAFTLGGQLGLTTGWDNLLTSDAVMDYVVRQNRLYLGWESES